MSDYDQQIESFVDRLMSTYLDDPALKAAKELKRLHDAYLEVGFTEAQAFELVRDSIKAAATVKTT